MVFYKTQAAELAAELRGKTLSIPNLWPIFQHWPHAVNENLHKLRQNTNDILERSIKDSDRSKLEALKSCDFALLTSCLFPQARWEELEVAGIFMLWIFLWDDEIDGGSSEVAQNKLHAQVYVQESVEYARLNLGVTCTNGSNGKSEHNGNMAHWLPSIDSSALCSVATMNYFHVASPALRRYLDEVQRDRLFREIESFMRSTIQEQNLTQSGKVPTLSQYLELRDLTSGIYPVITIFEFITQTVFPSELIESKLMRVIWKETCFLCMLINDIHSMIKELSSGSVLNVIPILFHADPAGGLESIMRNIEGMLQSSVSKFDEAAIQIESRAAGSECADQMQRYLDICRTTVTGLLAWSLLTKRYGLLRHRQSDGSMKYTL